jgi:chemotaxis family two-component system sensor kinase Cph1
MTKDGAIATVPDEGRHYSTLRHGLNITNCDSEPVRTPGCVQAHGALLVLRQSDLRILQASDNVNAVLGHPVDAILRQRVRTVIGVDGEEQLLAL